MSADVEVAFSRYGIGIQNILKALLYRMPIPSKLEATRWREPLNIGQLSANRWKPIAGSNWPHQLFQSRTLFNLCSSFGCRS